jgi:hypothetical protein
LPAQGAEPHIAFLHRSVLRRQIPPHTSPSDTAPANQSGEPRPWRHNNVPDHRPKHRSIHIASTHIASTHIPANRAGEPRPMASLVAAPVALRKRLLEPSSPHTPPPHSAPANRSGGAQPLTECGSAPPSGLFPTGHGAALRLDVVIGGVSENRRRPHLSEAKLAGGPVTLPPRTPNYAQKGALKGDASGVPAKKTGAYTAFP